MLNDGLDAASAAFEVGYESASQFSREYSRLFGQPPMTDVKARRLADSATLREVTTLSRRPGALIGWCSCPVGPFTQPRVRLAEELDLQVTSFLAWMKELGFRELGIH